MVMNSRNLFQERASQLKQESQQIQQPQEVTKPNLFQQRASELKKLQDLQKEEFDPEIERHIARLTSRGIEQGLGAPGNIRDFVYAVKDFVKPRIEKESKRFGVKPPSEPESFKKFDEAIPIAKTVSGLLDYLPTSSQLKKKSGELTKGYTEPKKEWERIGDEVFESLVSSALPGQGQRNIWRNIAAPIAGVMGKEAVKYVGGSEKSQALTQIGLNLAIPLMASSGPGLNRKLWTDLESNLPNLTADIPKQRKQARDLINNIETTRLGSAGEKKVVQTLTNFLENTKSGNLTPKQLVGFNKSINDIRGDPELLRGGYTLLNDVSDIIKNAGKQFEKTAPEFYKQWKNANEVHGTIANSNYVANFVRANISKHPLKSEGARALFGAAVHTGAGIGAVILPIFAIYKGTQILNRVSQSPQLLKFYTGVIGNSLRGNAAQMASDLNKLDAALLKEEKRPKPPFNNSMTQTQNSRPSKK